MKIIKHKLYILHLFPSWASVVGLGFCVCPYAITRFVISVIVDALNTQTGWTLAHIGQKILKAISPALANRNTPLSIPLRVTTVGVVAAVLHALPNSIGSRSLHAVRDIALNKRLSVIAATRPISAANQIIFINFALNTTLALAAHIKLFLIGRPQYRPASKFDIGGYCGWI